MIPYSCVCIEFLGIVKHNQEVDFDSIAGQLIQGADKSLALPGRKQTNVSVRMP